ncbi:T6SS effector amidase Tae4 family protein [uncultured Microbulbifer sp.]|uniref:T6SS effector amidase Tae4 family protein n=1 Tax=uncultured Microbulbifer sp. TaxID=348147 RepID=UPI0026038319|nr:T6SS effector amidase Tae4 family protein [uncultured Microbulbifer sp.]
MATVVVTAFYLHTHLGSTALTLDADAGLVNAFTYKAYGELDSVLGDSAAAPYGYTGKERDTTTGLGYFERRYLQSAFGTFISPDPVLNHPGRFTDPQRWTPYRYGRNNPINYMDPKGESVLMAMGSLMSSVGESAASLAKGEFPIAHKRPTYESMLDGYSDEAGDPLSGFDITAEKGGQLSVFESGHAIYGNTCGIRFSNAANEAGVPITNGNFTDASGNQYISSAHQVKDELIARYGEPDVRMYRSNFSTDKLSGDSNRGILFIDLGSGTGHVDLNTGSIMFSNEVPLDYYHDSGRQTVIMLWRLPAESK